MKGGAMIGALAGDIVGSIYEWHNIKTKEFPLFSPRCSFTDDSVLTIALADAILNNQDYTQKLKAYYRRYPGAGYGGSFHRWARSDSTQPYNSWGNGAAMRISPVGYAYDTLEDVLDQAKRYTEITHNHPEGIKGAQATAAAIFMSRAGESKAGIRKLVEERFGYDLSMTCDQIRPTYTFDVSCQGTVPQAIIAFLDSVDFEDALRNAISLGGDSDTTDIEERVLGILDEDLRRITIQFVTAYCDKT
jgi:ADP-ribosylglycohydrolase